MDKRSQLEGLRIDREARADGGGFGLKALLSALLGIALGLGGGYLLFGGSNGPTQSSQDRPSKTAREPATLATENQTQTVPQSEQLLSASGYVTARRMATVSAEITGRILDVLVEEGMAVEEGQIVARLDDTLAQTELKLAQAQADSTTAGIENAKAELAEAKRVLARNESLAKQNIVSEAALTNAQARVESAMASHTQAVALAEVARQEVARRREHVDRHLVRAPFAGVVVQKNAQPGEIISPVSAGGGFTRTGVCTVVDMDSLEIEVDINESFIARVRAGQSVDAFLDAYPDWRIPASVIAIVPTADRSKATVRVRIGIHVSDPRILPDMGVKVSVFDRDYEPGATNGIE